MNLRKQTRIVYRANDISPYIPKWWAMETLAILYENMVAARLVNRDFEPYFNKYGDVVNTRRPREFEGLRKVKGDAVTTQDAIADNIQVTLDQWCHVSFVIDDADATMSMKTLQNEYAIPAGQALARMVDRIVLGQYARFLNTVSGKLMGLNVNNVKDAAIDLGAAMDDNKAYDTGRNLILCSKTKADFLRPEFLTSLDKAGNDHALRDAQVGHVFGIDTYKDVNVANVLPGNTIAVGSVSNAAGYNVSDTTLTVTGFSAAISAFSWVDIDGIPYQVASTVGGATPTSITLVTGLKRAVANGATIKSYTPGAVNNGPGYAKGWNKAIAINGFTVAPKVGQFVTFGGSTDPNERYTIIKSSLTGITLDRSLNSAVANAATVNLGPAGAYNPCFHKDAITLAIRPLAPVQPGAGALSETINWNGLTIRVTISYDPTIQQHRWTFDFLAGIQVLDPNLGAVLLG